MSSIDRPIIQGWLNKMKSSRMSIGGHWNRRWVTIQNIGRGELALCYWNGPNDSSDPSGWIFIKEIDEVRDALSELPTNFRLGDKQKSKDAKTSKYDYIQDEIKKHKYTTFIITAMSRNFVFSAEDEDCCQHWLSCLFRLCGIPFDKFPWLSRWGEKPKVPDSLKEHWNSIRKDSPYRSLSGKGTSNTSARITNSRTSVRGYTNNNSNNVHINHNNYSNNNNHNNKDSSCSNRSSNQSFAGSPYHSDNSSEEEEENNNLKLLKPKKVKEEVVVQQEEKKSSNNETDQSEPPVYKSKNKNILPVDLVTPMTYSNSSEAKEAKIDDDDNLIEQRQQESLQVNMFKPGSTSPCGIAENEERASNLSRSDSVSSDAYPTPIPTVTPTCFNNNNNNNSNNENIEKETIKSEEENVSPSHFETTIRFKDDDDYDDWDSDIDKNEEEKKCEINEESKFTDETYGSNKIYDNTVYKAGVKEDENWLADDFDS